MAPQGLEGWQLSAAGIVVVPVVRVLTAAEIATLASAPVAIAPPAGVGTVLVPICATFQYLAGTAAFASAQPLQLRTANVVLLRTQFALGFHALTAQVAAFGPINADGDGLDIWGDSQADMENLPLLLSAPDDPGLVVISGGAILTVDQDDGGVGYEIGDTITLDEPAGGGTAAVLTVTGVDGGSVDGFDITSGGSGYEVGEVLAQASTSGIGTGFNGDVDAVSPISEADATGTGRLIVLYYVMPLAPDAT